jgi:hypothetical protein
MIAEERMIGNSTLDRKDTVFMIVFHSPSLEIQALLLIKSLRRFGGYLSDSPFWAFHLSPNHTPKIISAIQGVRVIQFEANQKIQNYAFGEKVTACTLAEKMASEDLNL